MKYNIYRLFVAAILAGMATVAMAVSNIYVATNGLDTRNGFGDWTNAVLTISNGIAHASTAGDTVWVSNGTYVLSAQLSITRAITVSAWSANSADTIIDGNGAVRCVNISGGATLSGFTISNGVVNNDDGGGVYLSHASGVVTNCFITQNKAVYNGGRGGGICMTAAGKVTDCVISNNTAAASSYGYGGAGLWCNNSGGSILNCRFLNNVLNGTNTAKGGGMGIYASSAFIVSNCVFDGNIADGSAGINIAIGGGFVRILDCTFSNNLATNGTVGGLSFNGGFASNCVIMRNWSLGASGGMYLGGGTAVNCVIKENFANGYGGGGMEIIGGSLLLNSSVINNTNRYPTVPGGVFMRGTTTRSTLRNCLVAGNVITGNYGVAGVQIHSTDGTNSVVQNCTIVFNRCTGVGIGNLGGVSLSTNSFGNYGNIIYYNTGALYGNYNSDVTNFSILNTCITPTNKLLGAGNITNEPQFVDTNTANYRLITRSPCVNAGLNQDWMTNAVDRDGRARIRYGTVDMGAYEVIYSGFVFTAF